MNNESLKNQLDKKSMNPATVFISKIGEWYKKNASTLSTFMGSESEAVKLWLTCNQAIRSNPKILNCTPESFIAAVVQCAQMKLFPGVSQEVGLVPLRNPSTKNQEVNFWPMYRGFIKCGIRSRRLRSVNAAVVYAADLFDHAEAPRKFIKHKSALVPLEERGKKIAVYAVFVMTDGSTDFELMPIYEVEKIMKRSPAVKGGFSSAWSSDDGEHFDEMAKKTVIKRGCKRLALSDELAYLAAIDNAITVKGYHGSANFDLADVLSPEDADKHPIPEGMPIDPEPEDEPEPHPGGIPNPEEKVEESPTEPAQLPAPEEKFTIDLSSIEKPEAVAEKTDFQRIKERAKKESEALENVKGEKKK